MRGSGPDAHPGEDTGGWVPAGVRESWQQLPEPVRRLALPLALVALAFFYPKYAESLPGAFPGVGTLVIMIVYTMMAVGLNIVVGYAGLLDLGYVAFYAAGAYTAAWFASLQFEQVSFHFGSVGISQEAVGIHISVWLILLIAGAFTAIAGILIGLPTLRLRGDYLAIVTLGFGEIIPQFVRNGDNIFGFDLTHGTFGISPIDSPGFGTTLEDAIGVPASFQQSFDRAQWFYWAALALLLVTVFCSVRLRDSRLGRAWIAIREDETAAAAMGIPLMRTKTWAYAIGAFFGGIAGAYYATFKSGAFPSDFFFNFSVFLLCMVILGGMGSVWGVVLGGLVLSYLDQEGLAKLGNSVSEVIGRQIDVPKYNFGVYGLIIVLMMLFRPTGLIPERRRKKELAEGVHDESLYDASA
ncbi:MAG: branched-chain amino acid ABC transporter permease [Gaiellaceae bacterium MAG52_C11]|nr:branched-chain amino acid ABC transporter permease [Candidatus Gaiellasilicea maunaloa]